MKIKIPDFSLVLMMGSSGSGKSTFARKFFGPHEVISSDFCRGMVSNDENDQTATKEAFALLHHIVGLRLKNGLLTMVDATNVKEDARKELLKLAKEYHVLPSVIVLDLPQKVCEARNVSRTDRDLAKHVIPNQIRNLKRSLKYLKKERFRKIYTLGSEEEVNAVEEIIREPLYNDKKDVSGPFDIIGDIHGCLPETLELLEKLGYDLQAEDPVESHYGFAISHPENRKVIFVGDITDRGPDSPGALKLVMSMVKSGLAYCVCGNHDSKLYKYLSGKKVNLKHGLDLTIEQLEKESPEFIEEARLFLGSLISHYVFENGKLVVAHAGLKESMHGRASGTIRSHCLYGETTGEKDEYGMPVRLNWAADYKGDAVVVYGHTAVPEAVWMNNTIDIDTGCVFGGKLTALRYPERELVDVPCKELYCEPSKPLAVSALSIYAKAQELNDVLDIEEVTGKRFLSTSLRGNIAIQEGHSIAALEVMSRFALHPKWLVYLPPTMSPCETSSLDDYLEYPTEALDYYRKNGVQKVICEEKHMGSRVVLVLCKESEVAQERFGLEKASFGVCYTRTGRNFFTDASLEKLFMERVVKALTKADFWAKQQTDWVCLDAELMPWSAKAQGLLQNQYASVGASAKNALPEVEKVLRQAKERGIDGMNEVLSRFVPKESAVDKFIDAYRNYCWEVNSIDDYQLAPFHILATEGKAHVDKSHDWHMETIKGFCLADPQLLLATQYKIVDFQVEDSVKEATDWWLSLTEKGGEGMVVKPLDFIARGKKGLLQPAVKCRGKEYLRIIYGPEYDAPANLKRLKQRGLSKKRSLALREFALGVEGLEQFVAEEALRKVHQYVFSVLALESETVDPRL